MLFLANQQEGGERKTSDCIEEIAFGPNEWDAA